MSRPHKFKMVALTNTEYGYPKIKCNQRHFDNRDILIPGENIGCF